MTAYAFICPVRYRVEKNGNRVSMKNVFLANFVKILARFAVIVVERSQEMGFEWLRGHSITAAMSFKK